MIIGTAIRHTARLINVPCPKCKARVLEVRNACCGDRRKGYKSIRRCKKCGYRVRMK